MEQPTENNFSQKRQIIGSRITRKSNNVSCIDYDSFQYEEDRVRLISLKGTNSIETFKGNSEIMRLKID